MQNLRPEDKSALHSRMELLKGVSLFVDIRENPEALEEIAASMEERSYKPKSRIVKEGEAGSELFVLIEGEASVVKSTGEGDHYKVAILQGEHNPFFGEGGLLDSEARSATIEADTECRCLVLGFDSFQRFSKASPQWAFPVLQRIAKTVMARLRKSNQDLMLLYHALVEEIRGGR